VATNKTHLVFMLTWLVNESQTELTRLA